MPMPGPGAIDCDIHASLPGLNSLLPYLDDYWHEHILARGLQLIDYTISGWQPSIPLNTRPDWFPKGERPASRLEMIQADVLDPFKLDYGILNCVHGALAYFNEDLSAVLCTALNDWIAKEWLDREPRLRASIVVPMHSPEQAAKEIERRAADPRFVQVLMLSMGETPPGRRLNWPIYRAAVKHGLPIGFHAGSTKRHAPTSIGWPALHVEDYVAYSTGFGALLNSLISEGVFDEFPELQVVLIESGVTWFPGWMWRANKTWRGVRREVPWVKEPPSEYARRHVKLTLQPFDAPPTKEQLDIVIEQIGSDGMILYSSDYPHHHYEGHDTLPEGLSPDLVARITRENPLQFYKRLQAVTLEKDTV